MVIIMNIINAVLIAISCILLIILIILFSPINLVFEYNNDETFKIKLLRYTLFTYPKSEPRVKNKKQKFAKTNPRDDETSSQKIKKESLSKKYGKLWNFVKSSEYLLIEMTKMKIVVENLNINISGSNPPEIADNFTRINMLVHSGYSVLANILNIKLKRVFVYPDFVSGKTIVTFKIIVIFMPLKILIALLKTIKNMLA